MDLDINTLRAGITVVCFLVFIGILAWAYSRRNRERFERDAQIPFQHDQ